MYIILWEYQVKPEKRAEFEQTYASTGAWSVLFRKATGYLGTELLHDESLPERYITIDRWDSKESFEAFQAQFGREYKELDAQCEGLTENETFLGRCESV
jgi:heme-degrading monooxygenase HmoA